MVIAVEIKCIFSQRQGFDNQWTAIETQNSDPKDDIIQFHYFVDLNTETQRLNGFPQITH